MSLVETILIGATDLSNTARVIEVFDGALGYAARRGSNYIVPGRDGAIFAAKPLDVLPFSIGLVLLAVDPSTGAVPSTKQERIARLNQNWLDLMALCDTTSSALTLTRKISTPGSVTQSKTCSAELTGVVAPTLLGLDGARCLLNFVNLDGKWA